MVVRESQSKAPRIRVHRRHKARAVMAVHRYGNNKLFHGKAVKGINRVLSINAPTLHCAQTKIDHATQMRCFYFFLDLTLICSWRRELNIMTV